MIPISTIETSLLMWRLPLVCSKQCFRNQNDEMVAFRKPLHHLMAIWNGTFELHLRLHPICMQFFDHLHSTLHSDHLLIVSSCSNEKYTYCMVFRRLRQFYLMWLVAMVCRQTMNGKYHKHVDISTLPQQFSFFHRVRDPSFRLAILHLQLALIFAFFCLITDSIDSFSLRAFFPTDNSSPSADFDFRFFCLITD